MRNVSINKIQRYMANIIIYRRVSIQAYINSHSHTYHRQYQIELFAFNLVACQYIYCN